MTTQPTIAFHDGRSIPQLGYGVWQVADDTATDVVLKAIDAGYRHIDTARGYENEAGVGRALAETSVDREDLFITSKVPNQDQGYDETRRSFDGTMADLGIEELDLYLIHWPAPAKGEALNTWKALIELREEGRIRSIGVSNFRVEDLEMLEKKTGVVPVLNQIELHPYFAQKELREYHASKGIVTEAWSPLGQSGGELEDPVITGIAEAHGAEVGQVMLAWNLAQGNVVISKSETPERIVSNLASLTVDLTAEEIAAIDALDKGEAGRKGGKPSEFSGHQGA